MEEKTVSKAKQIYELLKTFKYEDLTPDAKKKIAEEKEVSIALVDKARRKLEGENFWTATETQVTAKTPIINISPEQPKILPPPEVVPEEEKKLEEVTSTSQPLISEAPTEEKPSIAQALFTGEFSEEQIASIWEAVNQLFPEKHQRPSKAITILGKLWYKPANRVLAKYMESNVDLYLACAMTLLTFAPCIKGVLSDQLAKRKGGLQSAKN